MDYYKSRATASHNLLYLRITLLIDVVRQRQECFLFEPWILGLVEGEDSHLEASILPDDLGGVFIRVEGVHQDERNVSIVSFVQMLDLKYVRICSEVVNIKSTKDGSLCYAFSTSLEFKLLAYLLYCQIQEGQVVPDWNNRLWALATH